MEGLYLYDKVRSMRCCAPESGRPFPSSLTVVFVLISTIMQRPQGCTPPKFLTFVIHISLISVQRENVTHLPPSLCPINSVLEATLYLHSQLAVGLQHFVLRLVKGVLQPPLQHLDKTAGVDVIRWADEPQHCGSWSGGVIK